MSKQAQKLEARLALVRAQDTLKTSMRAMASAIGDRSATDEWIKTMHASCGTALGAFLIARSRLAGLTEAKSEASE